MKLKQKDLQHNNEIFNVNDITIHDQLKIIIFTLNKFWDPSHHQSLTKTNDIQMLINFKNSPKEKNHWTDGHL